MDNIYEPVNKKSAEADSHFSCDSPECMLGLWVNDGPKKQS